MTERLPINERKVWQGAKYSIERFAALRSVFCLIRMFKFSTMLKGKN